MKCVIAYLKHLRLLLSPTANSTIVYVNVHTLPTCSSCPYMSLPRAMAEELAGGGEQAWSRMSGYPSGRSVLTECMVERFSRSPHEWEEAFKNRDNRAKMLTEILAVESSSTKQNGKADKGRDGGKNGAAGSSNGGKAAGLAPSPFNNQVGDGEDSGKGKEKRRRQRGRGKRGKSSATVGESTADADAGGGAGGGSAAADEGGGDAAELGDKVTTTRGKNGSKHTQMDIGLEPENPGAENDTSSNKKKVRASKESPTQKTGEGREGDTATEVPKKKKRKRQEDRSKLEGVDAGVADAAVGRAATGDNSSGGEGADALVDSEKSSKPVMDGQAPLTTVAKKKKKKKKNTKGGSGDDGGGRGHGNEAGAAVLSEAAEVEEALTPVGGGEEEEVGVKKTKKKKSKKKSKPVLEDSMWNAVETPTKKRKGGGAVDVDEPKAAGSSGKKRKGGFRLF